ncbi:putative glycoside hydrolase family 2 protein [Rosellinia necatrix]|uniref:Beta-mannosidase A n=1 Tax=Rosellinia necatrix TaxID=77044 RepID=A0A1W2TVS3_ROSNE|nr:putative glycoside hydrolase family 2 protein [Rosellinia necatrix]
MLIMRRVLVGFLSACASAQSVINLSDVPWTVSNGVNVTVPGNYPSQAHLDLYAAGIIDDPLFGFNDVDQLWVQRSNWTWTSDAITEIDRTADSQTWLVFQGLDTFVEIKMCDITVANVANQFRQFVFDVSAILPQCTGDPILSLNFGSASKIVLEIAKTGPDYINAANGVHGEEFQGKIYMRKEQNDFGWDWSPSIAPAGPWRPAYLTQKKPKDPVYIHNTLIDIYRKGQMNNISPDQSQPWVFNASIDFLGTLPDDATMKLNLQATDGTVVKEALLEGITQNDMTITGNIVIDEPVDLWWPNGHGAQTLYRATITLESASWEKAATITKRVGFRTVVLNLNAVTDDQLTKGVAPGSNWHFEVNGHEFYAKGSNLVPPDVFWPRVNDTKIRELFELVVNSNQNMLRVWASGAYLSDEIYDMADEMGIFLWSEFEFTDAEYPVLDDFLENYEAEAYYNVRRVNHHPSLALWAGGNELEAIIIAYFLYPGPVFDGYERVFTELLIKCVYANTRSISYIPSSTYHGYLDLDFDSVQPQTPRYTNQSGADDIYANTDVYNYDGSQAFNFTQMPVGRFATEFGFISMPSLESWRGAIPESDLALESASVVHHNRHTPFGASGDPADLSRAGIAEMAAASRLWYPAPSLGDPVANFSSWCWTTQVFQADKYANEIAYYRRGSGLRERQLGALYWQLNDLWAAPTWATVEAGNRAKVGYHATRDIFTPVVVWPFYDVDADVLDVWVISDRWDPVSGTVTPRWLNWAGDDLEGPAPDAAKMSAGPVDIPFHVGAINATRIASYASLSSALGGDEGITDALLSLSLTTDQGEEHTAWFHPAPLAKGALRDPGLKLERTGASADGSASFKVTAEDAVAAWVWLDHPSTVRGYFDQNAFWLSKGESRDVHFKVWDDFTGDGSWAQDVTVRSMWSNSLTG